MTKSEAREVQKLNVILKMSPTQRPVGIDCLAIRYLDARIDRSQPRDPLTPIFEVVGLKHYVFARALSDFCL
jgi:hypothetical protein